MSVFSKTANVPDNAPAPIEAVAGNLAREIFDENMVHLRASSDKTKIVPVITVTITHVEEPR